MKTGFFYSKSTELYIARKPLKIDSRVKKAADKSNVDMSWDDSGRINFIDFDNTKKLLANLGAILLSPVEYWKVLADAEEVKDIEMVEELTSERYCEWLDRVYMEEGGYLEHPKVTGKFTYSEDKHEDTAPHGRPGWFSPDNNIDYEEGMPQKVELFREKHTTHWKYWSPDFSVTKLTALAPIRGYVTSVGKPSLDLGIPVDSKQPVMMVRECRKEPLELPVPKEILDEVNELLQPYSELAEDLKIKSKYNPVAKQKNKVIDFINKHGKLFRKSKELEVYRTREQLFNMLGFLKLECEDSKELHKVAKVLSEAEGTLKYNNLIEFIKTSKQRLDEALNGGKDVIFVMGHKNPDTDTTMSCLFEAWRNHVLDRGAIEYIPLTQNHKIPEEVVALLGEGIAKHIMLDREKLYIKAKKTGLARWISVDQNREPEVQKYFVSIVDHHVVSEVAKHQDIPKTMELSGSCIALVTQKLLGMGLSVDEKLARLLYGTALMDTENRVAHKMTYKDRLIMDHLKEISETENDDEFYSYLMSFLLNTDDPHVLFKRDYKEDWGFGFAVAKIKRGFDKDGKTLKKNLVKEAVKLAEQNNLEKNFPMTVLRITDYEDDNRTVNRERVYLIFNKNSPKEFIKTIFDMLEKIVKFEFGETNIRSTKEFVEFWGTGVQLSRKKTAPVLEKAVEAFHEYFYSPSVRLWIKRDFLKKTPDVEKAEKKLGIKVSCDKEGRINYITYPESQALFRKLGYSMLSLKEYWLTLNDAKKINDVQMVESLQGSNFVEFTDSVIKDFSSIIEHPSVINGKITGTELKVEIPKGKPGLILPQDIDPKTGIPLKVRKPNEYGNPDLWRYWEPDADLVIPTRSYIFLLNQPCWDGKVHIEDSFPNLGVRPCCKNIKYPKVEVNFDTGKLYVRVIEEGKVVEYSWKK